MLIIFSLNTYMLFYITWQLDRKYGTLGAYRFFFQSVSYEIVFFCFFYWLFLWVKTNNVYFFLTINFFFNSVALIIFVLLLHMECNRRPFDLVEGESELVRGFNVEYSGFIFAIIFLTEYLTVIFFCFIVSLFFFIKSYFFFFFMLLVFLLTRGCLPRVRFDKTINFI